MIFGSKPIRPLCSVLGLDVDGIVDTKEDAEAAINKAHARTLAEILQTNWNKARGGRRVQVGRIRRRDAARGVRDFNFEIGDFVLVYVARHRNKLRVKWTGPFHIASGYF